MMSEQSDNFFRRRRDELGLTQRDIAIRLNMTTTAVSLWESGDNIPRVTLFDRLAEVYQVSLEHLVGEIMATVRRQRRAVPA
jgi:transcriptional regulator with XRE-family HTH domain